MTGATMATAVATIDGRGSSAQPYARTAGGGPPALVRDESKDWRALVHE
jgi:hypothetical protein